MRLALWLIGGVAVLVIVGAGYTWLAWWPKIPAVAQPDPKSFDAALVRKGAALAAVGDCIACHTLPGGKSFAGGLPLATPFGTIYSSNITPDEETGIGRWSEAAFLRAMQQGVARDGDQLYPAFPYDHFTLVSDDDDRALYAYLMTRQPVRTKPPANRLTFPFGFRPLVAAWKLLYFRPRRFQADPHKDTAWNRGAYLAQGLGHCGACHTPRNALGAERKSQALAGGESEGWVAYPINAASPAPIPWDAASLAFYLRHGWHQAHGVAHGPMAQVTGNLAALPDPDIAAIARYIIDGMGTPDTARQSKTATLQASIASAAHVPAPEDNQAMPQPVSADRGAALYTATCASCHDSHRPLPFGGLDFRLSTAVHADNPQNIVNVVMFGLPPADGEASAVMPSFAGALGDGDIVALLRYLRAHFTMAPPWGNLDRLVHDTRTGAHAITVLPTQGIERSPANIGAED